MTKLHHQLKKTSVSLLCVVGIACALGFAGHTADITRPSEDDLVRLSGERLRSGIPAVRWKAGEPPKSNILIYAVEAPRYDPSHLRALANHFDVKGDEKPLPQDFLSAPGFWIKQTNPTNHPWFKAVSFSSKSGRWAYSGDEDDHKWDLKNHQPLVRGVPVPEEALVKTLALLSVFGVSTNDLEHTAKRKLRWSYTTDGTTYTDKKDGERKRFVRRINLMLWQRVHEGASTLSIGGGGMFEASFISEGHVAGVQCLFRRMKPAGKADFMTKQAIIKALKRGDARSFQSVSQSTLTVTNCAVVYPQHNGDHRQNFIWPFYEVRGYSVQNNETNSLNLYLPLAW